jgi:hypothetical protein
LGLQLAPLTSLEGLRSSSSDGGGGSSACSETTQYEHCIGNDVSGLLFVWGTL